MLRDIFNTYRAGQKYSKDKFNKLSDNKSEVTGELRLWFSKDISGKDNGISYCINDITISLITAKNEIDLSKREITGTNSKAYLTIDNAIKITIEEDEGKDSKTVAEYIDKAFNLSYNEYFYGLYSGGLAVDENDLNENQQKAIKYFLDTQDGYDFVKLFAKKGDVVMGKQFNENGDFYKDNGIGLIIRTKRGNDDSGSDFSHTGLGEKYTKKHFTVRLSKTGFGTGIEDIDILEALLHECFLHGYTDMKDYDGKNFDYDNISPVFRSKNYEPNNHHYHFTDIIAVYKGMYFKDLPNKETLSDKNGNVVIGLAYWPIKAFNILQKYTNGRVTDYKLQHEMMSFDGSQISISEQTGKIEDKK